MKENDKTEGPGYMGWSMDDSDENVIFSTKLEDLKICFNQLKENFDQLKADIKKKEENEGKMLKKQSIELSKLKEDYKECLKYLQKETFERNKAETTAKVMKETLEAHMAMKSFFFIERCITALIQNYYIQNKIILAFPYQDLHPRR